MRYLNSWLSYYYVWFLKMDFCHIGISYVEFCVGNIRPPTKCNCGLNQSHQLKESGHLAY